MPSNGSRWLQLLATVTSVLVVGCQSVTSPQPTVPTGQATGSLQQPVAAPAPTKMPEESAPAAALEKVKVAQIFSTGALGPYWIAKDRGIFTKYGLDVETVNIAGSQLGVVALNSGQVDALLTQPAVLSLSAAARDMDISIVLTFSNKLNYKLLARPDIKSVQDLKGKKLAVNRNGDSEYYITRNAIAKLGLKPDDIEYRTVGLAPQRLAALVQGMVDATTLIPPTDLTARKQGMTQLADFGDLGIPYVGNSLHVRKTLAKTKPQVVANLAKALSEAIYIFKTDKALAIKVLQSNLKVDDQEVLEYTWNSVAQNLEQVPLPSAEGMQEVIQSSALEDPQLRDLPLEKVLDTSFVKQIQASGFIDNLYKDTSNRGTQ